MLLDHDQNPDENKAQEFIKTLQNTQTALKACLSMEQQFSIISQNQTIEKMSREQLIEYAKTLVAQNYSIRNIVSSLASGNKDVVYPEIKLNP